MNDLKSFALEQIKNEINELEKEFMRNTFLLVEIKNGKSIGYPSSAFEIEKYITNTRNRIEYLLVQKEEMENDR